MAYLDSELLASERPKNQRKAEEIFGEGCGIVDD